MKRQGWPAERQVPIETAREADMAARTRKPLHEPESLQHIECGRCGESADIKRKNLEGWKLAHQSAKHFGQPWSAFTVRPIREQQA